MYVTTHGKGDFGDVIKALEVGRLFWIFWVGSRSSRGSFYERDRVRFDYRRYRTTSFANGGKGHSPKTVGGLEKLELSRK